ncbi:MAG: outer membrane lipoprotein chaperone LolA [Ignavibacteriales bacterium]|nr:outer membrane lipoprotein chaperone LolA [Ignavibacteriales bacterium]
MKNVCVIVLSLSVPVFAQQAPSLSDVTGGMQQRFEMIDNLIAEFSQQVKFGFSKIEQEFQGTLTMKKPNRYRVESEHQTLVTDGSTVWAYSPVNKQVVIDRYKENQNSITPDKFLLNLPESYYATVLGTEGEQQKTMVVLKLVPRDDRSFVKSVKLWVEDGTWVVRRILIQDVNESETTYSIHSLTLNTNVKDTQFSFSPPPGTEVVDLR